MPDGTVGQSDVEVDGLGRRFGRNPFAPEQREHELSQSREEE
jgi:hypothetical protein